MSYLRFADVASPALPPEALGFASSHVYRVSLKSGEIYTARIGAAVTNEPGADHYMRFHAGLAPATTNDAARAAIEQKVADLNASLSPWTFVVSRYTSDNMTVPRADLVRAKPAPANAVDAAAAPAATNTADQAVK
jgi:hypothetical protein